jgi:hypothetical protein
MVIVRTSRLSHPTVSCRHADRPGAGPTVHCCLSPAQLRTPGASGEAPRTWSRSGPASSGAPAPPGRRSARGKARRRTAAFRHSGVGCRDAPRPGSVRRGSGTRAPSRATTRNSSVTGARVRHPTQVRTGFDVSATLHSSAWGVPGVPHGATAVRKTVRARENDRRRPPGHRSATAGDPPPAKGCRRRRLPARRCGCRSGTR